MPAAAAAALPASAAELRALLRAQQAATTAQLCLEFEQWLKAFRHNLFEALQRELQPREDQLVQVQRALAHVQLATLPPALDRQRPLVARLPPPERRCLALLDGGDQCYKERLVARPYCGTHRDLLLPHGVCPRQSAPDAQLDAQLHLVDIRGVSLYVDAHHPVVYHTHDVRAGAKRPRIIGSYHVEPVAATPDLPLARRHLCAELELPACLCCRAALRDGHAHRLPTNGATLPAGGDPHAPDAAAA